MYKIRNKVYAEAGNLLIGESKRGYVFEGDINEFTEEAITLDDMYIEGRFVVYSNGKCRDLYNPYTTYEQYKTKFIKKLFSNDDQIAIMLNKGKSEQDDLVFQKMQEWRDWYGMLAKKIISLNGTNA